MRTVVAMYDRFEDAQSAVRALHDSGFTRDDINMVASDAKGEYSRKLSPADTPTDMEGETASGAAAGAGIGAVLGGMGGLLLGLGALAIPGIGPVLAAGPIVAALAGAGMGAVAGGLIGALVDLGVPEEHAEYYAEGIRRGGTLVTVRAEDHMAEEARMLLNNFNPVDISTRAQDWRTQGWTGYQPGAQDEAKSQVAYSSSAAVPVTGADADTDLMDDDGMMDDASLHRDTGDVGVTGMPYDRDLDVMDRDTDLDRDRDRKDEAFRDQAYGVPGAFDNDEDKNRGFAGSSFRGEQDIHDTSLTGGAFGAGSTYDRDVNTFGGSNIPVTGGNDIRDDERLEDLDDHTRDDIIGREHTTSDDLEAPAMMNEHLRDDVFGLDRAGMGENDIPITGGGMANADLGTDVTGTNWDMYDASFQDDYRTRYGMTSYGYDYYQPAYRFGYDLANDPRYHDYDWEAVEIEARHGWEMRGEQGVWDDVKDAVRHAWRTVAGL